MSKDFFKDIKGFHDFDAIYHTAHYHAVPDAWCVVATDVVSSTAAIQAGRYKDVNMVGAACIAAVTNVCADINLPYSFGGDGATVLCPADLQDNVVSQLLAVRRMAQKMYGLDLRVGVVPLSEIRARGKNISVAKYIVETGAALAMFQGGGMALADDLIKNEGFAVADDGLNLSPDLTGLSCRWEPITPRQDTMLTILVQAVNDDAAQNVYKETHDFITQNLDLHHAPLNAKGLKYMWPGRESFRQAQMVWRQGFVLKNLLSHMSMVLFFQVLNRWVKKIGSFDVEAYKQDMMANSDYRKFDDMLRMVVDCRHKQSVAIEEYLERQYQKGKIIYGTHRSDTALMTCFVNTLDSDGHVHFIDGNDGGYAVAAQKLKQQVQPKTGMQ